MNVFGNRARLIFRCVRAKKKTYDNKGEMCRQRARKKTRSNKSEELIEEIRFKPK